MERQKPRHERRCRRRGLWSYLGIDWQEQEKKSHETYVSSTHMLSFNRRLTKAFCSKLIIDYNNCRCYFLTNGYILLTVCYCQKLFTCVSVHYVGFNLDNVFGFLYHFQVSADEYGKPKRVVKCKQA